MENLQNKELHSRNYPFISKKTQDSLSELCVGLIGVGLSSQVADALVRLGVTKFKIWDNDVVGLSNLNRQAFRSHDVGKNKAEMAAVNMIRIKGDIDIEVHQHHFTQNDIPGALKDIDLVVNSADFETKLIYDINDAMQKMDKWCLQPLNLGFGGTCMVFGPGTPTLSELTGGIQSNPGLFIKNLLDSSIGFNPGKELVEQGDALLTEGAKAGWFPQNIIATLITTSLISWAVVRIVEGLGRQIGAPRILHFEPKI